MYFDVWEDADTDKFSSVGICIMFGADPCTATFVVNLIKELESDFQAIIRDHQDSTTRSFNSEYFSDPNQALLMIPSASMTSEEGLAKIW